MLSISHLDHITELSSQSIIIIENTTEKDYFKLANEDLKIEFDGECLYIHSPATKLHEDLNFYLLKILKEYLENKPGVGDAIGSRFAVKLPNGQRPEPDAVITPYGEVKNTDSIFEGVPLVVFEIISHSNRKHDYERKLKWYQDGQIPEIWLIDREEQKIDYYTLNEKKTYNHQVFTKGPIKSSVLKEFTIMSEEFIE